MITYDRKSKKITHMDRFTPEQNNRAHEVILAEYAKRHPEILDGQVPQKTEDIKGGNG